MLGPEGVAYVLLSEVSGGTQSDLSGLQSSQSKGRRSLRRARLLRLARALRSCRAVGSVTSLSLQAPLVARGTHPRPGCGQPHGGSVADPWRLRCLDRAEASCARGGRGLRYRLHAAPAEAGVWPAPRGLSFKTEELGAEPPPLLSSPPPEVRGFTCGFGKGLIIWGVGARWVNV